MPGDVISLLRELVRIPSVNPDNDPGTERSGEMELAVLLAGWLRGLGAETELEEVRPGRPNLIARFAPRDGRPRILFGPHLDTVGVGGMSIEPFSGEVRDGRVWGRGTSDTKGPMAAMLWALLENRSLLARMPVAVDFVGFMGEESGELGSRDFVRRHAADYCFAVVGEPTSLHVVHRIKGSFWATLRARGKAAHGSTPERGSNAILRLMRALAALDRDFRPALAEYSDPLLGPSTLNIGVVRGGSRPNVVPDLAEAELDIRATPALAAAGGAGLMLEKFLTENGLPAELVRSTGNPPMDTPAEHPLVRLLLECQPGTELAGAPWFSDAGHLAAAGVPAVCVGPGDIAQAHTADEFITLAEMERGVAFYSAFISALGRVAW